MTLEPQQTAAQCSDTRNVELSASSNPSGKSLEGAGYAVLAYGFWGFVPIYWKLIASVPAMQTVAHRVGWSVLALIPLLLASKKMPELIATIKSKNRLL